MRTSPHVLPNWISSSVPDSEQTWAERGRAGAQQQPSLGTSQLEADQRSAATCTPFHRLPELQRALGRSRTQHSEVLNICPLVKTILLDNSPCCGPGAEIVLEVHVFIPQQRLLFAILFCQTEHEPSYTFFFFFGFPGNPWGRG